MTHAISGDRLLARAFVASLALHVLLLALIPPLSASDGTQAVETISFVRMLRVAILHPQVRHAPAIAAQAPARAKVSRTERRPTRVTSLRPSKHAAPPASPLPAAPAVAAVNAGTSATAIKSQTAAIAPAATSPPQQDTVPPAKQSVGGFMPLGANEASPVLDPSVQTALAKLGVHVTLTITVGANGRTKAVAFAPPVDETIEDQIRSMLAAATWDPAVCGAGTACEASATIRL